VGQSKYFSYPANTATARNHFLRQQSYLEGRRPNTPSDLTTQAFTTKYKPKNNDKNYEPANASACAARPEPNY
jgi:hypothetical protein